MERTPSRPNLPFDESDLRRLAGRGTFQRGLQLLGDGHVTELDVGADRVVAVIDGTDVHRIELWGAGKALGYSCSCEDSADGGFCAHLVAGGLAAIAGTTAPPKPTAPAVTTEDVRTHLLSLDKEKLVDILMLRAEWDPQLRDQLFVEAAKGRSKGGLDVRALKEALDRAIETGGYVDWRGARAYAMGVEHAIDALVELFEQGHDADLLEIVEHALRGVEDAAGEVQDDGDVGILFERLHELHFGICKRARPDPVALARRLFEWEVTSQWGSFHDCAPKYADVFGEAGLAEFRRLAELAWKNIPSLRPGQQIRDHRRSDIARIMMRLVEKDGVDAVVDVLKKDLSSPTSFLRIAEKYRDAGRHEQAVQWAEKGIAAFPKSPDRRLQDFLADAYQRSGRGDEAVELAWKELVREPSLRAYEALMKRARENERQAWKGKAIEHVQKQLDRVGARDRSLLVQIFLFEGDVHAALREAKVRGCGESEWMQLAVALEKEKPAEAADIYAARLDKLLEYADNDRYRIAIRELQKIKALFEEAGQANDFAPVLDGVKKKHGRKTNLMRMIDRARW